MTDILSHLRNASRACTDTYECALSINEVRQIVKLIDRTWQAIETAPKDGTSIILAVMAEGRQPAIGEARWYNDDGGDWWWAGNSPGDYHGGPISEINFGAPTHWMPLPPPPPNTATPEPAE